MQERFRNTNDETSDEASNDANDEAFRGAKVDNSEPDYLTALLALFEGFPEVHRVILFGSRARGDHQERSDIALAVDAPDMGVIAWDQLCHDITENSQTLLPIDFIWLQRASARLVERIQREGVVAFEREDESVH